MRLIMNGAHALFKVLTDAGLDTCFANPGTSGMQLVYFANGIANLQNAGRASTTMVNVVGANATYHQPNFAEHELINGKIVDLPSRPRNVSPRRTYPEESQ
jgi:acetolactate synthase-1/2/3 large subunit